MNGWVGWMHVLESCIRELVASGGQAERFLLMAVSGPLGPSENRRGTRTKTQSSHSMVVMSSLSGAWRLESS